MHKSIQKSLFIDFTYGHISWSSSIDVAKPRSLLSVTTFKGSVHLDIAAGAQSSDISLDDTNEEVPLVSYVCD